LLANEAIVSILVLGRRRRRRTQSGAALAISLQTLSMGEIMRAKDSCRGRLHDNRERQKNRC